LTIVTAELMGFEDHFAENNACRLVLPPRQPPRVLIVDEQPATIERFAAALAAGGLDVQTAPPTAETFVRGALAGYDVVVLSDVSPAALGDPPPNDPSSGHPPIVDQPLAALESYVRAGGGLVVVGGDGVFGVDALAGTKLESLLPLKASPRAAERNPTLALVLIIDRSRSMLEDNRLELAKRAASQTVDELSPDDKVGVMAFGTNHDWITEIVPVGDKTELKQRIATLEAEGQTDMYPALERAYLALEQADADRRHAIVLTDGVSTPGDFDTIARRMSESGITVSTVSVSPGAEQQILKDIARIAGGEHYHCDDAADIVSILVRDTRRVETTAREYAPIVHQPLPGLDVNRAPALLGYVPTSPHGGAQLLLRTDGGDPLLAWRRHGRGMTVAFPADVKDRWGANWQSWPGLADFWSRLARYARRRTWDESQVSIRRQGSRATVSLDVLEEPAGGVALAATLRPFDASGAALAPQSISLVRTAPRHYEAEIDAALGSLCAVEVEVPSDGTGPRRKTVSLAHDYDDELLLGPAEESLLRIVSKQTGGRFAPAPDDVAVGRIEPRGTPTPLWRYFVLGAAVLLVVDVFVRRGPFLIGGRRTEDGGRRAEDGG
jgi:uncharacterized membrane protein